MRRISIVLMFLLLAGASGNLLAEPTVPYGSAHVNGYGMQAIIPLPYGPRAMPGATSALWTNPAGIGVDGGSGMMFTLPFWGGITGNEFKKNELDDQFGLGINLGELAFGMEATRWEQAANRYAWGMSMELEEGINFGWAYHWSSGLNRQNSWDLGLLVRPTDWFSFGVQATEVNSPRITDYSNTTGAIQDIKLDPSYHLGLAVRPFCPKLTLTADATLWKSSELDAEENNYGENIDLTFTAQVQPIPGIGLRGGYALDSKMVFAGISLYRDNTELGTYSGHRSESVSGSPEYMGTSWYRVSDEFRPCPMTFLRPKKIVTLRLEGNIIEEPEPFSFFKSRSTTIYHLLERVNRLKNDSRVGGMIIRLGDLGIGFSDAVELRDALVEFHESGKKLVFYADSYNLRNLYLASAGDKIILNPAGDVTIPGIKAQMPYLKDMLDKLGIDIQVVHIGKYKSAAEPLTREDMSEPAKEALDAVVETIWQVMLQDIADGRKVSTDQVAEWIDEVSFDAESARGEGLVDDILFEDEVQDDVKELFEKKVSFISSRKYFMQKPAELEWDNMTSPKIAVVYAVGGINMGKSNPGSLLSGKVMGAETVAAAIRKARSDKRVKAIVFRIDSGGGSALASDIILREIERTTNDSLDTRHVPVIVSMSDVAGSGGYYIACKADTIVAPKSCITGSIGVIGFKPNMKETYEKVGISHDGVMRGKHADVWSTTRAWDEEELQKMHDSMEDIYKRFVGFVADGRGMDTSSVNEIGQGRIWSGSDAKEIGLVDVNGGFTTAIEIAKEMAGIHDRKVELEFYPRFHGISISGELTYVTLKALPEPLLEILRAQSKVNNLKVGEPLLLMPLDDRSIDLK